MRTNEIDVVYENHQGLEVFAQLDEMRRDIKKLKSHNTELELEQDKFKKRIALLENEVIKFDMNIGRKWLEKGDLAIRRRFIDCYKRDILHLSRYHEIRIITAENSVAHDENVISDAFVFDHDVRTDYFIYISLYEFNYQQVLNYDERFLSDWWTKDNDDLNQREYWWKDFRRCRRSDYLTSSRKRDIARIRNGFSQVYLNSGNLIFTYINEGSRKWTGVALSAQNDVAHPLDRDGQSALKEHRSLVPPGLILPFFGR